MAHEKIKTKSYVYVIGYDMGQTKELTIKYIWVNGSSDVLYVPLYEDRHDKKHVNYGINVWWD